MLKRLRLLIFLVIIFFPSLALCYSSVTVPLEDPVYRKLDKLAAFGLVKTMMLGQRPYVRYEIARLIAEAMENYPAFLTHYRETAKDSQKFYSAKAYVDRILDRLKVLYHDELIQRGVLEGKVPAVQGKILESIQADFLYLSENKEQIPPNNGLGGIDGILQPLVEKQGGRHYQDGSNWAFETMHWVRLGKYFAFQAEPRFQFQIARGDAQDENKAYVQRLNGHFTYQKLDLEIGRDAIRWGPSSLGGLAFTANPRPLDFIKIGSISPFYFPYFFKKLGQNEMSLAAINLGPQQSFKNPWLIAHKISSRRNQYFEFGMTQQMEVGGEGAPSESLGQGFIDFFNWGENDNRVNRQVTFELLGRIPKFRGTEVYAEILFGDFISDLKTLFVDDTSYLAGFYIPRLNFTGTLDLRVEYHRLAPRYSRSPLFLDGMTENQFLLGDPMGPDSQAVFLQVFYELNPRNQASFSFQYSHFQDKVYQKTGNSVSTVADLGSQERFLYQVRWRRLFNEHFVGQVGIGLEQVRNANFVPANDAVNWLGQVGFIFYLSPTADL